MAELVRVRCVLRDGEVEYSVDDAACGLVLSTLGTSEDAPSSSPSPPTATHPLRAGDVILEAGGVVNLPSLGLDELRRLLFAPGGVEVTALRARASPFAQCSSWGETVGQDTLAALDPRERKRQEKIFELVHTEFTYLCKLQVLQFLFRDSLLAHKYSHDTKIQISRIFDGIGQITDASAAMLEQLSARQQANPCVARIGDVFADVSGLEACAAFCANTAEAKKLLAELSSDPQLHKELVAREQLPVCARQQLPDLLSVVFQRISKYPLLLEGILKDSVEADEVEALTTALDNVRRLAAKVDTDIATGNQTRDLRSAAGSLNMSRIWVKNLVNQSRSLLLSDTADWQTSTGKRAAKRAVRLVLLSDCLIVASVEDGEAFTGFPGDSRDCRCPVIPAASMHSAASVPSDPPGVFLVYQPAKCPDATHFVPHPDRTYDVLEFSLADTRTADAWCQALKACVRSGAAGSACAGGAAIQIDRSGKGDLDASDVMLSPPRPPPPSTASKPTPPRAATKEEEESQPAKRGSPRGSPRPTRPQPAKPAPALTATPEPLPETSAAAVQEEVRAEVKEGVSNPTAPKPAPPTTPAPTPAPAVTTAPEPATTPAPASAPASTSKPSPAAPAPKPAPAPTPAPTPKPKAAPTPKPTEAAPAPEPKPTPTTTPTPKPATKPAPEPKPAPTPAAKSPAKAASPEKPSLREHRSHTIAVSNKVPPPTKRKPKPLVALKKTPTKPAVAAKKPSLPDLDTTSKRPSVSAAAAFFEKAANNADAESSRSPGRSMTMGGVAKPKISKKPPPPVSPKKKPVLLPKPKP